jgi:hypothetical protein
MVSSPRSTAATAQRRAAVWKAVRQEVEQNRLTLPRGLPSLKGRPHHGHATNVQAGCAARAALAVTVALLVVIIARFSIAQFRNGKG